MSELARIWGKSGKGVKVEITQQGVGSIPFRYINTPF